MHFRFVFFYLMHYFQDNRDSLRFTAVFSSSLTSKIQAFPAFAKLIAKKRSLSQIISGFYKEASYTETQSWCTELRCQCSCSIRANQSEWPNRRITEKSPFTSPFLYTTKWTPFYTFTFTMLRLSFHAQLHSICSAKSYKALSRSRVQVKDFFFPLSDEMRLWPETKEMIVKPLMRQQETLFFVILREFLHLNGL